MIELFIKWLWLILILGGIYLIADGIISIVMRTNQGKWYYEPGRVVRAAYGILILWIGMCLMK